MAGGVADGVWMYEVQSTLHGESSYFFLEYEVGSLRNRWLCAYWRTVKYEVSTLPGCPVE